MMEEGGTKKPWSYKDEFIDLVFSWSLEDIMDDNLYKNQVEKIPESFKSMDQYFGSFIFPLLEETRAELASAMETLNKAPFSQVTSFSESKRGKLQYDIKVDYWRNRVSECEKEPYKTLPGDILLLSDLKPEMVLDLKRFGSTHTFGYVTKVSEGEDDDDDSHTSTNFKVKTAGCIEDEDGKSKSLYAVFLMNLITSKRTWSALCMRRNLMIVEQVLSENNLGKERCELCPINYNRQLKENFDSIIVCSKLNESQSEAVLASLDRIQCPHKSSVELIWGPPGTGKTKTLSVFLYSLLKMNVRTVVCAPTNVAISELASRLIKLVRDSSEAGFEEGYMGCPLGDMLLFGNRSRLDVQSEIEGIFLDYRVDRLVDCLVPQTGWRHCLMSMQDFLKNCVSQHCIYVDNQKSESCLSDGISGSTSNSFLEFARDQFRRVARPLRILVSRFLTHISERFLQKQNIQNMNQLLSLLDSIETMLFEGNTTSQELECVFLKMHDSESFFNTSSLQRMRGQCLSIIRSLQVSLANLGLPRVTDRTSIVNFCFQKASLIFCTTSSSFKLHSVDMEPVDLVVIDEAAQVKECESIIALQISNVRHAILVGDEWQLPAMVTSSVSKDARFGISLFERLKSLGRSWHLLNTQYRMHPSISRFPNLEFYRNQILDAPSVQSESHEIFYLHGRMFGPYSFINVIGGKEEMDDGHSRRNMAEVAISVKLVERLYKAWNGSLGKLSIGLISPYAAQVVAIQNRLKQKYENLDGFVVKVKSVDGFQGGEEDIIIISTVRSNRGGNIGFLSSPQRSNVALTRARHCLWILGSAETLSESNSVWERLICDAKNRQCFFNADEDHEIDKAVINIKKELAQLDDLLNGDNILFKNARWKVLFSQNFQKSFQKVKSSQVKKLVINTLLKIASGWRPKKINVDISCKSSSYVVKQFKVEGYSIICSIDIKKESSYVQVLKVWDILPVPEVQKLLNRLDSIFATYTEDFINCCLEKCFDRNFEVPMWWPSDRKIVRYKNLSTPTICSAPTTCAMDNRTYVENSRVSESLLLMKFYSLSIGSVSHLLSDEEGREVDLPFEVTDEEHEIIIFPRTSFILGRSGTGKTTILTMKLYQRLQQYYMASDGLVASTDDNTLCKSKQNQCTGESKGNILRQLFVTVSPKLCYAIRQHVSKLKSFAGGRFSDHNSMTYMEDLDEMAEFEDIPDSFVRIEPEKYPLIITFHKFLMMLDGTVANSYFERFRDVRDAYHRSQGSLRSVALQTFIRTKNVTYDRFWSIYWPHFNEKLTKILDPSVVFTEIMSHIKGGLQADDGKRSREEYISLSDSRVSTLSAEKREMIYDIFQDYEKMKIERGEFDLADLVIDIHIRLSKENFSGDKMDFVYIDEVQDLTMRQIALFRYVCENIGEGFVFSGDTAQTIARGIDFRFQDIRSLFYNEFLMKCESGGRREKGLISDTFHLCQNFRTHSGVLRLAQSVVDIIYHFFPQSIDVLAPETSLICGESPVLLEPGSDDNAILTIFGQKRNADSSWVGFGAEQVIVVRDESVKQEITEYIGGQALILTIVESKGLEFQDVLLYNFFGSSPLSNQWRVLYQYLEEKNLLDTDSPRSFPSFNESRHNILSSELKQLYVAITRTRQRLWICENNIEVSKPMFDYWRRMGLVQVRKVDDSLAEAMQRASSPEEWKSQGIKLFWEKNYEMATMCFEKAGEETWEKRAKASGLRAAADHLQVSNSKEARIMLREAAEIFDSIGRAETAAECFCDLGEYERAGNIYLEKCGISGLSKAGECFVLAGCYKTAADVFSKGNFFSECLSACIKGKDFDKGLQYLVSWKHEASWDNETITRYKEIDQIGQQFLETSARECYNKKDKESMIKFVRAFDTFESKRAFLKSLDCLEELLVLEEENGNFIEATELAKLMGNVLLEVDLLEKAGKFADAYFIIHSYVLSNSIWATGIQGWPLRSFPRKEELLFKSVSFAKNVSENFHASVSTEARTFSNEPRSLLELMQAYLASRETESLTGEILSTRKLLDAHFQVNPAKYEWELGSPSDSKSCSEDAILRNQVSVRTLVYVWTLVKENILEILECLDSLEKDNNNKRRSFVEFCEKYFGVKLSHDTRVVRLLLNSNAGWIKNVDERFFMRNRNMVTLEARHFVSAARIYWVQELVSVGLRVLDTLQDLHKHSIVKSLSSYCQGTCLTCIFDIVKLFNEHKLFDIKKGDVWKLQNFMQLSTKYFEIVFPLDSRQSLSENMILLRQTEASKNLLEEIISTNISGKDTLTYGQMGRTAMILLGSGKPKPVLNEEIHGRFCENEVWKSFIETLVLTDDFQALSEKLQLALKDTYDANWRMRDYISPNCFLYLLERLLILPHQHQGFLFASKSSFVEWLISQEANSNPIACLTTGNQSTQNIPGFVLHVIQQFLFNIYDTEEWIKRSNINCKYYFPLFMLRLFMILSLLCLNSNMSFDILFKPLLNFQSLLPREFCESLKRRRHYNNVSFLAQVAGAFRSVGDPIVIVTLQEKSFGFVCPDAVYIDLKEFSCKEELITALFPKRTHTKQEDAKAVAVRADVSQGEPQVSANPQMIPESDSNSSSETGQGELQKNLKKLLCEASDTLESLRNDDSGEDVKSFFSRKKVEIEEHVNHLSTAVAAFNKTEAQLGEEPDTVSETNIMIEELKRISSLLDVSDRDRIGVHAMNESLKSVLEDIILRRQNKTTENVGGGGTPEDDKVSSSNLDSDDESKTMDSGVPVTKPINEPALVKGKNKKKKSGKKGKGGRKK